MKSIINRIKEWFKSPRFNTALKLTAGGILLIAGVLLIVISSVFRFDEWHDLDPSLILDPPEALIITDKDGEVILCIGNEKRICIDIDDLQKHTVDAFVSAEDARFYTHKGLDLYRIFGAAWADLKAGSYVQGASTISQQLIKLSHLSSEKTLDRKLEEAVLATELERVFEKDEIMQMYLNYIYFGSGYYGIEAASLGYFGVHATDLTTAQSAQLAGILKSPAAYAPHLDPEASLSRRNVVLKLMRDYGYIDQNEYDEACAEECVLSCDLPSGRNWFIDYALDEVRNIGCMSYDELLKSGFTIETTYDESISTECEKLISDDALFPSDNAQAAMVVLDGTGGIAAMIGGRGEYTANGLNRASDSERQPGSLIKPILVYAPALELKGYSAADIICDEPTDFGNYCPRNSDDKYYGNVTLRTAVTKSLNIPAVKLLKEIGINRAVEFASSFGVSFESESIGLPLALGGFTHGVSPLEMAGAYSSFASGGLFTEPKAVNRITDKNGGVIYERPAFGRRVMSEQNAFILTSMLESVASEGTGKRLNEYGIPLAAKTGTAVDASGVRDAWCAAYTNDYTAVIWMGTDSALSGSLPSAAVGGNNTAVILGKLFETIYKDKRCAEFNAPEGVVSEYVDMSDADEGIVYIAGDNCPEDSIYLEYFVEGTGPRSVNPYWQTPVMPDEVGWYIDAGKPVISFTADSEDLIYRILRSDYGGAETTVFETTGKKGFVSFKDDDVTPGGSYVYRIIAIHPVLKDENGGPLMSEPSRKLRVIVPFYF